MRTKALLCAAALVAGAATAMAQSNVYSLNVVGYVNVPVQSKNFYILANPVVADGGNYLTNVLKLDDSWDNGTEETYVMTYANGLLSSVAAYYQGFGWYSSVTDDGSVTNKLDPGTGFFLYAINTQASPMVSFAGTVQTTNTLIMPPGFSLVGSAYPSALSLTASGIQGQDNGVSEDAVMRWNGTTKSLHGVSYYMGYGWYDADISDGGDTNGPAPSVAEGFYYLNQMTTNNVWTQNFIIQ